GQDDEAALALRDAADAYGELGLRFDRGRTLLSLGHAQRRVRKWAQPATHSSRPRPSSTRWALPGGPNGPAGSSRASGGGAGAPTPTSSLRPSAEWPSWRRTGSRTRKSRARSSSPCAQSRSTSGTRTPSSESAPERSWRADFPSSNSSSSTDVVHRPRRAGGFWAEESSLADRLEGVRTSVSVTLAA